MWFLTYFKFFLKFRFWCFDISFIFISLYYFPSGFVKFCSNCKSIFMSRISRKKVSISIHSKEPKFRQYDLVWCLSYVRLRNLYFVWSSMLFRNVEPVSERYVMPRIVAIFKCDKHGSCSGENRGDVSPLKVLCRCALFADEPFKYVLFEKSNQKCTWISTSEI